MTIRKLKPGETIETRGVLGGAYVRDPNKGWRTHSVVVRDDSEQAVLCRRVKLDNIADFYAPGDHKARPTCPQCLARDPRFAAPSKAKPAKPVSSFRKAAAKWLRKIS